MEPEEWQIIRNFIANKAHHLMSHEKKDYARIGFDLSKYRKLQIGNRIFFVVFTPVFYHILENVLSEATLKYPKNFGTRKTETVLEALYSVAPWGNINDFSNFLGKENFAWIIELSNGTPNERILRADLFRKIDKSKNSQSDFTGGIFHAFKHFSLNDIPLSTHNEKNNLDHPFKIINLLIEAFFLSVFEEISETDFRAIISLNNEYNLRFEFYLEPITKVYFIKTIIKEKKNLIK